MKINIGCKFKKIDGEDDREMILDEDENSNPKRDSDGRPLLKRGPVLTLRLACINVLKNPPVDIDPKTGMVKKETSAEDNLKYADLAMRIYKSNAIIELEPEEATLLRAFINKRYNQRPLIVKQAHAALNPTAEEPKKPEKKS